MMDPYNGENITRYEGDFKFQLYYQVIRGSGDLESGGTVVDEKLITYNGEDTFTLYT